MLDSGDEVVLVVEQPHAAEVVPGDDVRARGGPRYSGTSSETRFKLKARSSSLG